MTQAPNRGARKCETCIHFTDKRPEWAGTPNLKWNDPGYRSQTYVDTSGMGLSGSAAGMCEWKCPPILKRLLFGEWGQRLVAATDWCHCWEEHTVGPTIAFGLREIEASPAPQLSSNKLGSE